MTQAYFFGYGSLVNRKTHNFTGVQRATLKGWRRVWRHTDLRPVAYLTVVPDPAGEVEGLIAEVPDQDWAALDERERAYDRVSATDQITHSLPHSPQIAVYSIPEGKHCTPSETYPVLLSYIDVVVQGHLQEFGKAGVARFFETTDGWDIPVINDRNDPIYPRHQSLTGAEQDLVNQALRTHCITLIEPPSEGLWPDP